MISQVGEIAKCLLCLICLGPILIIIGMTFVRSALEDNRLIEITTYNSAVANWNSAVENSYHAIGTGKGMQINAVLSTVANGKILSDTAILVGKVAPQPIGDKSLRKEESFSTIKNPWYYSTEAKDQTITNVSIGKSSNFTVDLETIVSLTFTGADVTSTVTAFYPVVAFDTPYSWKCIPRQNTNRNSRNSRRRSGRRLQENKNGCPNTCNNPLSTEKQDSSKQTCDVWCTSTADGVWTDNGKCYDDVSTKNVATGCCHSHWGAKEACYQSTVVSGKLKIVAKPCKTSNTLVKSEDGVILYGTMKTKTEFGEGMQISIRHADDPFITASGLTNGCSSASQDSYPTYVGVEPVASEKDQCFGWTPGQNLMVATILFVIGGTLTCCPALVLFWMYQNSKNKTRPTGVVPGQQMVPGQVMMIGAGQQQQYCSYHKQYCSPGCQQPQQMMMQQQFIQQPQMIQQQQFVQQPQVKMKILLLHVFNFFLFFTDN